MAQLPRLAKAGNSLPCAPLHFPSLPFDMFIRKEDEPSILMPFRRRGESSAFLILMVLILCLVFSIACTQQMAQQPRYDPLEKSDFFADTMSARPLPVGVIARDYAEADELFDTGMENGKPAEEFPFPITREVLDRGRQRYDIYCSPCHDYVGTGDGMAARRGFRRHPASFQSDVMRASPPGHFFDVMTNGFGAMPSYAGQIVPHDRWAIVAYIRALQLSQSTTADDVPADERNKLDSEKR